MSAEVKPIKTARHHWWPQCVSKQWFNQDGLIYQLFNDGTIVKQKSAKNFGAIKNAHTVKFAEKPTVWDCSFENSFDEADSSFSYVLGVLERLDTKKEQEVKTLKERFLPQDLSDDDFEKVILCILSLVVRSPRFRFLTKQILESYRKEFPQPEPDETLINLNLRNTLKQFERNLKNRGKLIVLFTEEKEFIFGDGFFNNFVYSDIPPLTPRAIVPLLPNLCVFYLCPLRYNPYPKVVTLSLKKEEVDFINFTTMVYSKDFVFYRSQKPEIPLEFESSNFLQYENDSYPYIEELIKAIK